MLALQNRIGGMGNQRVNRFVRLAITQLVERIDESKAFESRWLIEYHGPRVRVSMRIVLCGMFMIAMFREIGIIDTHEARQEKPILVVVSKNGIGYLVVEYGFVGLQMRRRSHSQFVQRDWHTTWH